MTKGVVGLAFLVALVLLPGAAHAVTETMPAASPFSWGRYFISILLCILLAGIAVIALYLARNGMSLVDPAAYRAALDTLASRLKSAQPDVRAELLAVLDQKRISPTTTATVLRCGTAHFLVIQGNNGQILLQDLGPDTLPSPGQPTP